MCQNTIHQNLIKLRSLLQKRKKKPSFGCDAECESSIRCSYKGGSPTSKAQETEEKIYIMSPSLTRFRPSVVEDCLVYFSIGQGNVLIYCFLVDASVFSIALNLFFFLFLVITYVMDHLIPYGVILISIFPLVVSHLSFPPQMEIFFSTFQIFSYNLIFELNTYTSN